MSNISSSSTTTVTTDPILFDLVVSHGTCADGEACVLIARLYGALEVAQAKFIEIRASAVLPPLVNSCDFHNQNILCLDTVPSNIEEILNKQNLFAYMTIMQIQTSHCWRNYNYGTRI